MQRGLHPGKRSFVWVPDIVWVPFYSANWHVEQRAGGFVPDGGEGGVSHAVHEMQILGEGSLVQHEKVGVSGHKLGGLHPSILPAATSFV